MGCIHGKCCSHYPASSNADPEANRGDVDLNGTNNENGYYPDFPDKENQDSHVVKTGIQGNPNLHFFGVFDGHGQYGTQCSNFVKERLIEILENDTSLVEDPVKAHNSAFLAANSELHESEIDDTMSGTTAITVLVSGDTVYVANVGDSRAVIAVKDGSGATAEDLSIDQTPFRKDECERLEGLKDPDIQNWGDEESDGGDPPRLWVQDGMYPGTAFTRSLGDSFAEKIGVIAVPEVKIVQLTPDHLFFVIASDGVFEFLSSQAVTDMSQCKAIDGTKGGSTKSVPQGMENGISDSTDPEVEAVERTVLTEQNHASVVPSLAEPSSSSSQVDLTPLHLIIPSCLH
ncbi:hypothetical protein C5167_043523 [Papaver somniferum]|uniref:protein-serine/threonine phosphatase n=1 Tax=Papaver somniferum TaxID=3469 RepID=A0A4Y7L5X0_PAPSO|nr:hypothetical protein C5167_043523 [Papaver somniferum]